MFWGKPIAMQEVHLPMYHRSVTQPKLVPWRGHVGRQMPGQSPSVPANPAEELGMGVRKSSWMF